MIAETRYQRIAREQAERRAARERPAPAPARRRRKDRALPDARNYVGPDPDGFDRDDLGESPDR